MSDYNGGSPTGKKLKTFIKKAEKAKSSVKNKALERAKSLISKKGLKIEKAKDDAWNKYGEYKD